MPKATPERILIVGPSWVGDMVMAEPLFALLKRQQPDAEIHVLAPAWSRPLLARMPSVDEAIDMPLGHGQLQLGERYRLGAKLRGRYRRAIVLPNSLKSALVPWFARIPERTGWRGEMRFGLLNDIRLLNKADYPLMQERYLALGLPPGAKLPAPLPAPRLVAKLEDLPDLLQRYDLSRLRPTLALCPGAEFGPSKRWPESHYAALAQERIDAGWQVWIMGSEKDAAVAAAIIEQLSPAARERCFSLAGRTKLAEAIDLLAVADAIVSNDSGLMHIAAALDRPLVAVYGSTSPAHTPPMGSKVAIESIQIECAPCFQRECPLGHHKCMRELHAVQVNQGLERVLAEHRLVARSGPEQG